MLEVFTSLEKAAIKRTELENLKNETQQPPSSLQMASRASINRLQEILRVNRTSLEFDPEIEQSSLL